jgi:predicted amidophosphoribosyltransferase
MKFFNHLDLLPLRSCLNCGSWLNLRTFFCLRCHEKLFLQFHKDSVVLVDQVKLKSLFRWPAGKSDVLSSLVLQMKDEPESAWKVWAQEFVIRLEVVAYKKQTILVSSESSTGKKHAQNWANALSSQLGYTHICALRPLNQQGQQKKLSKFARANREFELTVDFSILRNKRIIFVDDVVTTGQTALAAFVAMKEPSDFQIWSLIYREL